MRSFLPCAAIAAAVMLHPFTNAVGAQQGRGGQPPREPAREPTRTPDIRIERVPGSIALTTVGSPNRAALGVMLSETSREDTEGVRIEDVRPDSPAARAGLRAGDVITAIDGVSLSVSQADADDPTLAGLAQRRLTRTLGKAKAGDTVELRVLSGGRERNISVRTVAASELESEMEPARSAPRATTIPRVTPRAGTAPRASVTPRASIAPSTVPSSNQGVIGLSIGGSGSARDTLGLFINSVVKDGPAERAGVVEGERIAEVNGVDVRVPMADVDDMNAMSARANRFIREVQKVAPGENVSLRVYSGGRYRDVNVRAVRSSDLPNQGFRMSVGDGSMTLSLPRSSGGQGETRVFTRELSPSNTPRLRINGSDIVIDRAQVERAMEEMRRSMQEMGRNMRFELRTDSLSPSRRGVIVQPAPRRLITRIY
ncbi:MAG: PDZ domain-containing protein [Gemmatimonadota bacterium]